MHQKIGHIPLRIVPSYYKANLGMVREKRHILQLPIHQVIRTLMQIGNPRELSYDLEWMLCPKSLHKALNILKFNPEADMQAI